MTKREKDNLKRDHRRNSLLVAARQCGMQCVPVAVASNRSEFRTAQGSADIRKLLRKDWEVTARETGITRYHNAERFLST